MEALAQPALGSLNPVRCCPVQRRPNSHLHLPRGIQVPSAPAPPLLLPFSLMAASVSHGLQPHHPKALTTHGPGALDSSPFSVCPQVPLLAPLRGSVSWSLAPLPPAPLQTPAHPQLCPLTTKPCGFCPHREPLLHSPVASPPGALLHPSLHLPQALFSGHPKARPTHVSCPGSWCWWLCGQLCAWLSRVQAEVERVFHPIWQAEGSRLSQPPTLCVLTRSQRALLGRRVLCHFDGFCQMALRCGVLCGLFCLAEGSAVWQQIVGRPLSQAGEDRPAHRKCQRPGDRAVCVRTSPAPSSGC